jgi:hypothetical protein
VPMYEYLQTDLAPDELDTETRTVLMNMLKEGVTLEPALVYLRLDRRMIDRWVRQGLSDILAGDVRTPSALITTDIAGACASAQVSIENMAWRHAANGDWRATLTYAQRYQPEMVMRLADAGITRSVEQESAERLLATARVLIEAGVLSEYISQARDTARLEPKPDAEPTEALADDGRIDRGNHWEYPDGRTVYKR